jgi:two-component system sensor histidine kinase MtrB
MLHGGGEVTIRARQLGGEVAIEVADRGPGIPPASLQRIFDRFYKEDTARSAAGSGLGLSIAMEHARVQGGGLRAANRPDGGACFTFTLPAPTASAWEDPRSEDRPTSEEMPTAGGRAS